MFWVEGGARRSPTSGKPTLCAVFVLLSPKRVFREGAGVWATVLGTQSDGEKWGTHGLLSVN